MSSWSAGGWQVVALQDILVLALAAVEGVVLSPDGGNLKMEI